MALMGGIAIFSAFVITSGPLLWQSPVYRYYLGALVLVFVLGLVDDRRSLTPQSKLLIQIMAAAILIGGGFSLYVVDSVLVNLLVSFFWLIGITNAFNLLDHMDGVSPGVAAIAAATMAIVYASSGFPLEAAVAAGLAGASLGFLVYNRAPATIFMGDSGSLFLGLALAGLAVSPAGTAARGLVGALFVPVLILLVPILDTSLVILTRLGSGRSIAQGGVDHTTHRLVVMGLSERAAAATLWGFAALGGAGALLISYFAPGWPLVLVSLFLFGLLLFAFHLARLRVYEPDAVTPTRMAVLVSVLFHKKRVAEVLVDLAICVMSFFGALFLMGVRWESVFDRWSAITVVLALVVIKTSTFGAFGLYKGKWRNFSLADVPRYAAAIGTAAVLVMAILLAGLAVPAVALRVAVLDFVLTVNLVLLSRISERLLLSWGAWWGSNGRKALIYGPGRRGELLARLLQRGEPFRCGVVGFVDDLPASGAPRLLHSRPVLGTGDSIGELIARYGITDVFVACTLDPARLARVARDCESRGVTVTRFEYSFGPASPTAGTLTPAASGMAGVR